ncbi:MAG: NUDIX domain-containing protein [Patescibacteria group bacterium]|nr:NUDIX domain-containing protein [Patescibacteria group bacterium]
MKKQVVCRDMAGRLYKVDSKKLIFRPSIYGILIEKNKILLSKQFDGYDFPGGGAYIHETIEETLKREFWEETGFKIKPGKIIYVDSSFWYSTLRKQYWNCQLFYFLVKKIGGKLSKENFDEFEKEYADMAEWIDFNKLKKIKFYNTLSQHDNIKIIKQAFKKINNL